MMCLQRTHSPHLWSWRFLWQRIWPEPCGSLALQCPSALNDSLVVRFGHHPEHFHIDHVLHLECIARPTRQLLVFEHLSRASHSHLNASMSISLDCSSSLKIVLCALAVFRAISPAGLASQCDVLCSSSHRPYHWTRSVHASLRVVHPLEEGHCIRSVSRVLLLVTLLRYAPLLLCGCVIGAAVVVKRLFFCILEQCNRRYISWIRLAAWYCTVLVEGSASVHLKSVFWRLLQSSILMTTSPPTSERCGCLSPNWHLSVVSWMMKVTRHMLASCMSGAPVG